MKIAYCIRDNGEKIEVTAHDEICKKYSSRLICPYCGEQVNWINGKIQEKHFRHHHSSYSQECENYSTSISTSRYIQPYECEGLPLYLIKEFGAYSIAIGLYGLSDSTIQEAESMNFEVEIDTDENSKIIKKVNTQYFAPHKMEFVKISTVKQQYRLKFSKGNIPIELKEKWSININGIGLNGAIFYSGNYGGKKVSSSSGLEINEEYLLFTSYNMNDNNIYGISFQVLQEITFGWHKNYKIYKFVIKEINEETIKFCDKFDMSLQYSTPEVIPIWPPCTKLEQELIYKCDSNKFFILNTDNGKEKDAYSHILQQKMISDKINDSKYLIASAVKFNDFISIGNLRNQFIFSTIKGIITRHSTMPDVQIETNTGEIIINTNSKIFVNQFKKDVLLKSSVIKQASVNEIKINANEKIDVLYGLDTIWSMWEQAKIKDEVIDVHRLDKELLDKINKCKGPLVIVPDSFKWMVVRQRKYQHSYKELQKQMKKNRVSIELINLLRKY